MASIKPSEIQQLVQLLNSDQLAEAEKRAKALMAGYPREFILHQVYALSLDQQQRYPQAAEAYAKALVLNPQAIELWFNFGIVLTTLARADEAETAYRKAIALNPRFFEAYGNLGALMQQQGRLEEAIACYQSGLKVQPQDAKGHFNLGTALRDQGALEQAIQSYQQAITLFPNYVDAYNNLGETLRDQGNMPTAIECYQQALAINPNHAQANYNMGEFLYLAKRYEEAIPYLEASQLDDWQARKLYCLYQSKQFEAFKKERDAIMQQKLHTAPLIATLSTHYSINHRQPDPYQFCPNGLDFVLRRHIPELAPDSPLLKDLLSAIAHTDIAERKQARLTNGRQSAGNLFKRPEPAFRQLAELVKRTFKEYREHFIAADCMLIKHFPEQLEFTSSWYIKIQRGGHLESHIHEIGWISGAVYLAMPDTATEQEGAFEYGTHGDNYPQHHENFPVAYVKPKVGDIVLFPSSLFHRTIPFNASAERICVAFDLKPSDQFNNARSAY